MARALRRHSRTLAQPRIWRSLDRGRYGARIAYTFAQLEEAIRASWGPDTVDPDDGWSEANPAQGHCDVTCLVVNDLVGGELGAADVFLDGQRIMAHMWNRLPSGIEIDLTREQFTRGEILGEARFVQRPPDSVLADPAHHRHHRYLQYLVLADRVRSRLGAR
jgi:hypothetical protein